MRFVLPRKLGTGSGLPNATAGFKPLMLVMMATQKLACIHRKKHVCNSPCYVTDAYILLSQMDHSDALSFSPVSELFTLFVWYNLFPWDCTCSIKSRKKPFSRATNITHTNSHTHTHTRTACEDWRNAFRQTFLSQVFHSFTHFLLASEYALAHKGTCTGIPFCQLSAPDHVTIKDAALQLNTASKSQGKESWEKHLFLSSMRDHTGGRGWDR